MMILSSVLEIKKENKMSLDREKVVKENSCQEKLTDIANCVVSKLTYKDDVELAYNATTNQIVAFWHVYKCNEKHYNPDNRYHIVPVDSIIANLIVVLNDIEAVVTKYSCGGHEGSPDCYIDAVHNDACNEIFNEMLVAANKFNKYVEEIPMFHQSVKVETTVNVNVDDQLRCTLRIDGNYINRKLRATLIAYICRHLIELYLA